MGHVGYLVIGVIALSIGKNIFFVAKNAIADYKKKKAGKVRSRPKLSGSRQ